MTKEQQEQRNTEKPSWLELPEEAKQKHVYWTCVGFDVTQNPGFWERIRGKKAVCPPGWRSIFHSKEEAEAHAAIPSRLWKWDGKEARPYSLQRAMKWARTSGDFGVRCIGWRDGRWQTLKEWPAGVPLMGEEQGS